MEKSPLLRRFLFKLPSTSAARASQLLQRDDVAYVHVRSARNNCFQCRIDAA